MLGTWQDAIKSAVRDLLIGGSLIKRRKVSTLTKRGFIGRFGSYEVGFGAGFEELAGLDDALGIAGAPNKFSKPSINSHELLVSSNVGLI